MNETIKAGVDLEGLNLLLTDSLPLRLSAWSITSSCNKLAKIFVIVIIN